MTVPRLMRLGKAMGLEAVSVTDHDTMEGLDEVLFYGGQAGLKVVPGVELSSVNPENGKQVHILGYWIKDRNAIAKGCKPVLESRNEAVLESLEIIKRNGYPIDLDDVLSYRKNGSNMYKQWIMHALMEAGFASSIYGVEFDHLFGRNGIAKVKPKYMPVSKAVSLIREAGGLAVLAHPFHYGSMDLIPQLASWGLSGIECWHKSTPPEGEDEIKAAALKHGLFLTGGSDWHGFYNVVNKPLGFKNVDLPNEHPLLAEWL
jgi:predicted metal-dependent phosphoesterase TrpH